MSYERQALVYLSQRPRGMADPSWNLYFQVLVGKGMALVQEGAYHITALGLKELEDTDVETGETLKKEGQERVLANTPGGWRARVLNAVYDIASKQETLTIVDVRVEASDAGEPHHANAWGTVLPSAAKEGWIEQTDQFVKNNMKSAQSRMVRVWRSLIWR